MTPRRKVYITDQDLARLNDLVGHGNEHPDLAPLIEGIGRALVVPQELIPPNVVTMNSKVRFRDMDTNADMEATIVYPKHADDAKGRVSILDPIGLALMGLTVGDTVEWPMPEGGTKVLKILEVLYQPEAEGDWEL